MVKNRIGEVRKMRGLTQQQLADEVNKRRKKPGKMYREDVSMIESGRRNFSSGLMELIAEALEVEIGDLFFTSRVSCNDTKED